jgi:thioredoxin reductase (NADPH)
VYLGRSRRDTLLVHSNHSMIKWEPDVQNYLGFPEGIDGKELLRLGEAQVRRFQVEMVEDEIQSLGSDEKEYFVRTAAQGAIWLNECCWPPA